MAKPGTHSTVRSGGAEATRQQLIAGAIESLREDGFAGASARAIAGRAGCNQGLVFYHFGSVANLLLAALDEVSRRRRERYEAVVAGAHGIGKLVEAARAIFQEDLDAGHITVLAEMIAGAAATPGLGSEVAARIAPWRAFAAAAIESATSGSPFASLVPPDEIAHAVVALYLGLEMLAHLDERDRAPALALFDRVHDVAKLFAPPLPEKEMP